MNWPHPFLSIYEMTKFRYQNTEACYIGPNNFLKLPENQITTDFIYQFPQLFFSHNLLRPSQFLEKFMEILNGPLCRNKSGPYPPLNVAAYWKSSNTEACGKNLPQILASNIYSGGRGLGLRTYLKYFLKK